MMDRVKLLVILACGGLALGCNSDASNGDSTAQAASQPGSEEASPDLAAGVDASQATAPVPNASAASEMASRTEANGVPSAPQEADQVVAAFLEATRIGNRETAELMLTRRAVEETRKHNLTIQPAGSEEMSFRIGDTAPAPGDGIYVQSVWILPGLDGEASEHEVVWLLRREPEGWRIAGMVAELTAESEPVFLDFEAPDELVKRVGTRDEDAAPENLPPEELGQSELPQTDRPQSASSRTETNPIRSQ